MHSRYLPLLEGEARRLRLPLDLELLQHRAALSPRALIDADLHYTAIHYGRASAPPEEQDLARRWCETALTVGAILNSRRISNTRGIRSTDARDDLVFRTYEKAALSYTYGQSSIRANFETWMSQVCSTTASDLAREKSGRPRTALLDAETLLQRAQSADVPLCEQALLARMELAATDKLLEYDRRMVDIYYCRIPASPNELKEAEVWVNSGLLVGVLLHLPPRRGESPEERHAAVGTAVRQAHDALPEYSKGKDVKPESLHVWVETIIRLPRPRIDSIEDPEDLLAQSRDGEFLALDLIEHFRKNFDATRGKALARPRSLTRSLGEHLPLQAGDKDFMAISRRVGMGDKSVSEAIDYLLLCAAPQYSSEGLEGMSAKSRIRVFDTLLSLLLEEDRNWQEFLELLREL